MELLRNSGPLHYRELANNLLRAAKREFLAKGTEKTKFFDNLKHTEVDENLEDHGCPKVQDLADEKSGLARVTRSDTKQHLTLQSARQNCFETRQCRI